MLEGGGGDRHVIYRWKAILTICLIEASTTNLTSKVCMFDAYLLPG